jgi:hypothetical protein
MGIKYEILPPSNSNPPMKIEYCWPETVFSFKIIVTLNFDLVTTKSIGVFSQYGQSSFEV